jgi:hypothetical protein
MDGNSEKDNDNMQRQYTIDFLPRLKTAFRLRHTLALQIVVDNDFYKERRSNQKVNSVFIVALVHHAFISPKEE